MKNNLVHIAISPNILASLIERGYVHAVDFKCLNADSKKTVWKLFLSAVKLTKKNKSGYQEDGYV
jgi:hypothetical protein